jgi:hypothetical protein
MLFDSEILIEKIYENTKPKKLDVPKIVATSSLSIGLLTASFFAGAFVHDWKWRDAASESGTASFGGFGSLSL